jgi:hypothetical protein
MTISLHKIDVQGPHHLAFFIIQGPHHFARFDHFLRPPHANKVIEILADRVGLKLPAPYPAKNLNPTSSHIRQKSGS